MKTYNCSNNCAHAKRRYISSVEKEQGYWRGSKAKRSYKCGICNKAGHNATFHKKKGNNRK
ncbi:hypothetical protein C2G38_2076473 [Gigaspora rosea]|uniref:Uncharacterized protein n=1 Tax=Gigaspora rosea TaxID=44941 RepID=A0A397VI38_9GLOM|nr:hypothetical protein C2G38_2076473 [Gigaspora rosea]